MKQRIAWIAIVAVATLGFYAPYSLAAKAKPVKPVDAVWQAIADLKNQIANISLTPGPQGEAGPQGPAGEKGEQGIPGAGGVDLHLYDANDQALGTVLTADGSMADITVFNSTAGGVLHFRQERRNGSNVISMQNDGAVSFAESNCTGQVYVSGGSQFPGGIVAVGNPNGYRAFRRLNNEPVSGVQFNSVLLSSGCLNNPDISTLSVVEEVQIPFSFPLAFPLDIR